MAEKERQSDAAGQKEKYTWASFEIPALPSSRICTLKQLKMICKLRDSAADVVMLM